MISELNYPINSPERLAAFSEEQLELLSRTLPCIVYDMEGKIVEKRNIKDA